MQNDEIAASFRLLQILFTIMAAYLAIMYSVYLGLIACGWSLMCGFMAIRIYKKSHSLDNSGLQETNHKADAE